MSNSVHSKFFRVNPRHAIALITLCAAPELALAHSFGRLYTLPVPFWLYAYGAAAALLLSFLVAAFFISTPRAQTPPWSLELSGSAWLQALRRVHLKAVLQFTAVALLLLCIATGLWGTRDPYRNFNMTFFWIMFLLCFAYLTALCGNVYAALNPWRSLAAGLDRVWSGFSRGRWRYPQRLAYWPALALYMAFIWIELFAFTRPHSLAVLLIAYTAITLGGIAVFGAHAWLRYGEFFGVMLRLIAKMAPLDYVPGQHLRLRAPFAGLLQSSAHSWSLLLFVLFMLSSTAFDGLRATVPWFLLFWGDATGLLERWIGTQPIYAYVWLRPYYLAYETLWLIASPFLYLAVYLLFVAASKVLGRSPLSVRELALRFAFSLLPIALVYNITHYYTLILTQGVKIISLLSDPFGYGWNLFGTAGLLRAPILPDLGTVWHTQVGLILFGHIVSVWLAHVEALRTFPTPRRALLSQLPMLLLMVAFTTAGLWILAQPIQSGRG
ncbi:hypothetical protein E4T66_14575 [Sinimarinibacterium sp. CAU 1509]|uniref:hypothetical protein n=1 Tax=Sinimarinibacterium sp. CAU 1509 TaxID=2562283 RepID=UPI0010AB901E|nr:hypothetical protein [Sinimarinibacterium sp. CAU 1509]TJY58823.1 hypothetical protein E4T66_14575 [Sinimarinibacterium sp. CAU 1509]